MFYCNDHGTVLWLRITPSPPPFLFKLFINLRVLKKEGKNYMNNSHEAIVENMPACILDVAVMRRESFAVYFTWRNYLFRIVYITRFLVR